MAIIVVLAAVAIPTFGKQLETSRETNDMEIIRNAYTEALSVAILDAADGVINGKIGDSATADAANESLGLGAVTAYAVGGKYTVTVANMNGAKFSQFGNAAPAAAGTVVTTTGSETGSWQYVGNILMNRTVPPVNTKVTTLQFTFKLNAAGEVVLDGDSSTAVLFVANPSA